MRLSTKILLLILTITLALAGMILLAVRRAVTQRETAVAHREIDRAIDQYVANLDVIQDRTAVVVHREMDEPETRASLDLFSPDAPADARATAATQLGGYIFSVVLQRDLTYGRFPPPSFHALIDRDGRRVVSAAPGSDALDAAIQSPQIVWPIRPVLAAALATWQYMLVDGRLFLTIGVPLQQTRDEAPNFAYLVGFAITDRWAERLLEAGTSQTPVSIAVWFSVDDTVIASAARSPLDPAIWRAARQASSGGSAETAFTFGAPGGPFVARSVSADVSPRARVSLLLVSSLHDALAPLRALQAQILLVTCIILLLAILAARWVSRILAKPVEQLVEGTLRIAQGHFNQPVAVKRNDELGKLAHSFNEMAGGLAQRDLIKASLGQFVDPRVAEAVLTDPESLRGRRSVQTILFSDLEKFTQLSEQLAPEVLVALLNDFLGASADIVKRENGYLDKFSGDGVVAFWGPPVEADHALAACRAAIAMVKLSHRFTHPPLRVRIGIATGEVIMGIIGSETSKKNYTALGDVVNLASRIEGANKVYGTQILISGETARQVSGTIALRKIDTIRVVGRTAPVELYEVLCGTKPDMAHTAYESALSLYAEQRFGEALERFSQLDDPAAATLAARCRRFLANDPPPAWDGVWTLDSK
jgi:class 3 adenylate cyclase